MSPSLLLDHPMQRVNQALDAVLPKADSRLHQAMRYVALNPGKRIRAALVYASAELFDAKIEIADAAAAAVELIHAYSLVHDDLPAMDDDDLRRGQPSCHIQYDEWTAILVGDALQTLAFETIAAIPLDSLAADNYRQMLLCLSQASGSLGMVGGQAIDMASAGQFPDINSLSHMHQLKTGKLIEASVILGALAGQASPTAIYSLKKYAYGIGMAFQIQDDILDVQSDTATLGKQAGQDERLNKATYPKLLGLAAAKQHAQQHHDSALQALSVFGDQGHLLRALARLIIERNY